MKHTSKSLILLLALGIAYALGGCSQDPQSPNNIRTLPLNSHGGGSTPAHPELTYVSSTTSGHTSYETIAVMDSAGANRANVYTASSSSTALAHACWSPTGGSVAWVENANTIKACDVSVNSSGVPVGSNTRTIYTSSETIEGLAWCSESSTGLLAYTASHSTGGGHGVGELYTISESGGTPTMLASLTDTLFNSPTWSPDDSKIGAIDYGRATHKCYLWVVNFSSGSLLEDDNLTNYYMVENIEWARSGNTIAFDDMDTNVGTHYHIDYIDYGSGNGSYTQHTLGSSPTWSPNDADLMINNPNSQGVTTVYEMPAFGTSTTDIATVGLVKWKRQR